MNIHSSVHNFSGNVTDTQTENCANSSDHIKLFVLIKI